MKVTVMFSDGVSEPNNHKRICRSSPSNCPSKASDKHGMRVSSGVIYSFAILTCLVQEITKVLILSFLLLYSVKLTVKYFTVPEFSVEIPETVTVGVLKV